MIRKAKVEDINRIMEIVKDSVKVMSEQGNDQWGEEYPLAHHYEGDINEGSLYVYEDNGLVLGVACISSKGHGEYETINWSYQEPSYSIKRLAVDPQVRKKGIGLAFYQKAEDIALQNGVHYIRTDTYSKNKAALRLFEKANYRLVQEGFNGSKAAPFYYFEKKF
ncbi:ribosomal protein S18 acetylase RimI-like enzyme [Salirhabdus euzebyi]|uniref:Ribosomal protein S18 acetylase RimI-like enzyme n=1 Tax=Salirhabdus euzebyi TaxID=394506 RepID=A0A841Q726_9BACI|nr:GNAT family N-acetyltransferase [Salirhabdus euzebyi]MBB6454153.1 ribosomal protein S18 acetylase RimI-like enzyme [Salirhabdus euzebyi]